jgi:hypothetical protein
MQKEKQGKKGKKIIQKILFIIIILLVLVFLVLLSIELGILDFFKKINREPQLFVIDDKCALVMGKFIHEIKGEGDCKINCEYECKLRELKFTKVEFIENSESCNKCDCYCV